MSAGPLAVIAGRGRVVRALVETVERSGRPVFLAAIAGFADPLDDAPGRDVRHYRPFHVGALVRDLRARGIVEVVFVGKFDRLPLGRLSLDSGALRHLPIILLSLLPIGDDGIARRVSRAMERLGFRVLSIPEVAPELVARPHRFSSRPLDAAETDDARIGFAAAADLGRRDLGQAVVVRAGRVVAEEGLDGTDAMLGRLAPGGGVLVKRPKPQQALRDDMPVIGPATVEAAIRAGLSAVVIEAGGVVVVEAERAAALADAAGLALVALDPERFA